LINYVEITLDYIFDAPAKAADAEEYLNRHLHRRHKGPKQKVWPVSSSRGRTRYDGPPYAPNLTVVYAEHHSRVTGELFCLHVERRINGVRAVRNAGIRSGGDLLDFDHHEFWRKKLVLYDGPDPKRLGRFFLNPPGENRNTTDQDHVYAGGVLIRSIYPFEVERLIEEYGPWLIRRKVLVPLTNEDWLPPPLQGKRKRKEERGKSERVRLSI
jgi:hypothetical protein